MSDVINIGRKFSNIEASTPFEAYSKVIIHIDDETQVSAGKNGGRVLEVDNPLGTKAIAQEMLDKLNGFRYQPYEADGAILDPAAEIGDAINTPSVWGGIYTRNRTFGRLMRADISAPHDEEINHEYQYESPMERQFKREMGDVHASLRIQSDRIESEVAERKADGAELSTRITQTSDAITTEVSRATQAEGELSAALSIQAEEISAKVSESGGSNASGSFSWALTASGHRWYANGNKNPVMEVTADGLTVRGVIEATSGKIGGFDINQTYLSYNGLKYGDTDKNKGAYIGQSGIQLGNKFKVDNSGNLSCANLRLTGNIQFYDSDDTFLGAMSAADLKSGAQSAYNWSTDGTASYWSGGAGYGYNFGNATSRYSGDYPDFFRAGIIYASNTFQTNSLQVGTTFAKWMTATIGNTTIHYLGY